MYSMIHADGSGEVDTPLESLSELYDELLLTDDEHPDVSVEHEGTGWCISAYRNGRVILISRQGDARHMKGISKKRVIQLSMALIEGDILASSQGALDTGAGIGW